MKRRSVLRLAGMALALAGAFSVPSASLGALGSTPRYKQRSVSNSQQFVVYCPDTGLRIAVTGYVETAKEAVLETLGVGDHWKMPIVVNMERPATTDPGRPLCQVNLFNTDEGPKIELDIVIREDQFKEIRFPQQIIRAILLEMAYRKQPPRDGESYVDPPGWLVEGLAERLQAKTASAGPNAALFKQLIDTGRLPAIRDFLKSNVAVMDSTSRSIYAECALSLLDMLTGLPAGKASLARLVSQLGEGKGDSADLLLANFPGLGGSETSLEKWWTLGLARYSASDRYSTFSVADTDARLAPLLTLEIVTDQKKGTKTPMALADFKKFVKLRTARPVLYNRANALGALLAKSHPLLRPVIQEYQRIVTDLARKKTRGVEDALEEVGQYRAIVVERMDKITDYLNWFEATQMPELSGAFDNYLKAAGALENAQPPKRMDALSRYVDQVEREFE